MDAVEPAVAEALYFVWDRRRLAEAIDADMERAAREDRYEAAYWARYHAYKLEREFEERAAADAALSAAVLQIARQGISLVHGQLSNCPPGRMVSGSVSLAVAVWHGSNQATHWEEGRLHSPVQRCFESLAREVDGVYGDYAIKSMPSMLIELLNWRSAAEFRSDLALLGIT